MPVPDFQSLMLPVLRVAAEGEHAMADLRERVAAALALSADDLAQLLPSGRKTLFSDRISWAKSYMEKAGLVDSVRRGVVKITARGQRVLADNPSKIDVPFLLRFNEFEEWLRRSARARAGKITADETAAATAPINGSVDLISAAGIGETATPEERIEVAFTALDAALRADLLARIAAAPWQTFERLVVDLLVALGYGGGRAEMAQAFMKGGDQGLDGVVKEDALGLDVVYIQAKRWALDRSVGAPEVQAFVGALHGKRASKGVFATTGTFSRKAREYVASVPTRVVLIDGAELAELLVRHDVAVRPAITYAIKRVDEDYFIE